MADTISPANSTDQPLWLDIRDRLEEVEFLATKSYDWTEDDIDSAREVIPDLITVIQKILAPHDHTRNGSCPPCGADWPCAAVRTTHGLLTDPDRELCKLVERAKALAAA